MRTDTAEGNKLHHEALAVIEAAVKSGVKITYGDNLLRSIKKETINNKSRAKPKDAVVLKGLNPTEQVKAVLTQHKQLTRLQIVNLTELSACSISRAANTLEADKFLTRGPSGQGIGREVLFSVTGV